MKILAKRLYYEKIDINGKATQYDNHKKQQVMRVIDETAAPKHKIECNLK